MNGRPIALGYPPEAERMVVPRTRRSGRPDDRPPGPRRPKPQKSLDAFLAGKARFDAMVAELQRMSAEHFGADPEAVLWGEHGTLQHWNELLAQVTDAYSRRGEWAE